MLDSTYARLELVKVRRRKSICLCNNWDEVDTCAKTLHDFDVERLECVTGRTNEVQARVHPQINLVLPLGLLLLQHVALMLVIKELDDWLPAVSVIHIVTEPWSIDDSESDFEELLFQLGLCDFDLHCLVDLFRMTTAMIGVVLDSSAEESVDESGLAKPRLASDHHSEGRTAFGHDLVALIGQLFGNKCKRELYKSHSLWQNAGDTHVGNANRAS